MTDIDQFIRIDKSHRNIDRWIIRASIRDALREVYPRLSGRLLDAGCGKMPYKSELLSKSKVADYVGLDIESAIIYDDQIKPDFTWNGSVMPFDIGSFDCVIATEVLEHVPDIDQYLMEVKRVLRPGGIFFFTTPFIWPYHEAPNDRQRWTSFGLTHRLEKAGFNSVVVKSVGNWHSSLAQMIGLYVARAPMPGWVRRLIRIPAYWVQRILFHFDTSPPDQDNCMPRMLVGTTLS